MTLPMNILITQKQQMNIMVCCMRLQLKIIMLRKTMTRMSRLFSNFSKEEPEMVQKYTKQFQQFMKGREEQKKRLEELELELKLINKAGTVTSVDRLFQGFYKVLGKNYEPKAFAEMKSDLLELRKELEATVQEAEAKWQVPRKQINQAREEVIAQFLAQFPKLEDALSSIKDVETSCELKEGGQLTYRLLISTLEKYGAVSFTPAPGDKFDPKIHETAETDQTREQGHEIQEVLSMGWRIRGDVSHKSMVRLKQK